MAKTWKHMARLQAVIVLAICSVTAGAQIPTAGISFDKLSVKHGLSQVSVLSIFRDSHGYLWFGTRDGLNRYDGLAFKVFRSNGKANSISNNFIRSMDEDANGLLWIGTEGGLNSFDQSTGIFKTYSSDLNNPDAISNNRVLSVLCASNGDIWVGTENGLNLKKRNSNRFIKFFLDNNGAQVLSDNHIYSLFEDKAHNIWIGTRFGGLYRYEPAINRFTGYGHDPADTSTISSSFITSIAEDRTGAIWVGTSNGLNVISLNGSIRHVKHQPNDQNSLSNDFIRSLAFDHSGNLWIATYKGLNYLDISRRKFQVYEKENWNSRSLSDNSIRSLLYDKNGFLWIGTYFGGINIVNPASSSFLLVGASPSNDNSLSNYAIGSMAEDKSGNVWIGSEGGGLFYYDKKSQKVETISSFNGKTLNLYTIKSLLVDSKGNLWVGTYLNGLFLLDHHSRKLTRFTSTEGPGAIRDNTVLALREDQWGNVWIGTDAGLNKYDPKTRLLSDVNLNNDPTHEEPSIACLFEDTMNNLWIGTKTHGLIRYSNGTIISYTHIPNHKASLSSNAVYSIREDLNKNLWIGTYGGGLNLMNREKGTFKKLSQKDGLLNEIVYGIQEDHRNNLWITTPAGISRYDQVSGTFRNYTPGNSIPIDELNENSLLRHSSGLIFIGGLKGLLMFHPQKITENRIEPKLVFHNLKVFSKSILPGDETQLLKASLDKTTSIELSHDQNVFTIEYGAFSYPNTGTNRYAYILEGFDREWNFTGPVTSATYTNLDAGSYIFKVRVANGNGLWSGNIKTLKINKLPPPWKTTWAYLAYACLGVLLFWVVRKYLMVNLQLENKLELEKLEKKQIEKLTQMKLDFFTNISHDFRTPLTLIHSPLDDMIRKTRDAELQKGLISIKRNSGFMLRLINQLMYFRKIENENTPLNVIKCAITPFVRDIMGSFQDLAVSRRIHFSIHSEITEQKLLIDKEKIEKVLYNILSNAFKYTPDGGEISVTVQLASVAHEHSQSLQYVEVSIKNSGMGIAETDLKNIFNRFYQTDNQNHNHYSTGIGLSIAKDLVELHQGYLKAKSEYGHYAEFLIGIPVDGSYSRDDRAGIVPRATGEVNKKWSGRNEALPSGNYSLLIVEDNLELRSFLEDKFKGDFSVVTAGNGEEALISIANALPSIIISDILMPRMSGLELAKIVKSDKRTCHIPVLLLTEKGTATTEIDSYRVGADDFISKPFNLDLLRHKISNLISSKEKLREHSRKEVLLKDNQVNSGSSDHRFLQRFSDYLRLNIADPELSISKAGHDLGLSRVHLYRKVKAVSGKSPIEFIRDFRLSVAAKLLEQNNLNVNEICDEVGFQDLGYFRKCFKQKYGVTPKDYASKADKARH